MPDTIPEQTRVPQQGSSEQIRKSGQREILLQGNVWKTQEYFVYFKFSKRQNCGKRSDERRRGFVQRFLKPKRQFETILSENKTMECYK